MITPTEVRRRLKEIRKCTWDGSTIYDDEKAHALEDQLYTDVLKTIASPRVDGCSCEAKELARLALNTRRIRFERWAA